MKKVVEKAAAGMQLTGDFCSNIYELLWKEKRYATLSANACILT